MSEVAQLNSTRCLVGCHSSEVFAAWLKRLPANGLKCYSRVLRGLGRGNDYVMRSGWLYGSWQRAVDTSVNVVLL